MPSFTETLPPSIRDALARWALCPGASLEAVARVEVALRVRLPPDLVAFYRESNGGSGQLGQSFLALEAVEGLAARGSDYDFDTLAPHLVLFGTNGGGEGFAVDRRDGAIVIVPLHEPRGADAVRQGTFRSLLERVAANTQFEPW